MTTLRRLITPKKDWRVRVYALFLYVILDYVMTSIFCNEFTDEANTILRTFMIHFNSVPVGLFVFTISYYSPVYVMLCYFTNRDWRSLTGRGLFELISEHVRPLFDVALGLGVASRHFEGAMSWILPLSNRLWLALGFVFYLSIVHLGTQLDIIRS